MRRVLAIIITCLRNELASIVGTIVGIVGGKALRWLAG
jgi:hypothetical protein